MLATASESGLITLIVALCRFVTQIRPFGATAIARGAVPTTISRSLGVGHGVEHGDRIVVLVHHPQPGVAGGTRLERKRGGRGRPHASGRRVDGLHGGAAYRDAAIVVRRDGHVVDAGRGERVRGGGRVRPDRRRAVAEVPAVDHVDAAAGARGVARHTGDCEDRRERGQRGKGQRRAVGHGPGEGRGGHVDAVARGHGHVVGADRGGRAGDQAGRRR